jgi:hypothetical protein
VKLQHGFNAIVEREKGLHRSLSTGQLSMIAIGGAIGTGLFLGSGFAIGFAGPGVLVSYAIGALIALLLMGCLAEMTVAHPTSGSFGAYAEHYIAPWAGFLVRYAYWSSIVLAVGAEVTAIAVYMKYWFPGVPGWYWIVGFSAALIGVNVVSVKMFGAVEYVFSMLKIVAIVGFILLGAYVVFNAPAASGIGLANYRVQGGFFPKGAWGTWVAVIVSIFSYLSIEMIAVAAGEARDPHKAITSAFRATMIRLVVFYLLTLALMLAIVPWTDAGANESPFVKVIHEQPALHHHADDVQSVARRLCTQGAGPFECERCTDGGATAFGSRYCGGHRAQCNVPGQCLPADDVGVDVRRDVDMADDLHHTSVLPPPAPRPGAGVSHVGVPGNVAGGRRADGGGAGYHLLHARVPDDAAVRRAVHGCALGGVWRVVSPASTC